MEDTVETIIEANRMMFRLKQLEHWIEKAPRINLNGDIYIRLEKGDKREGGE